MNRKPHASSQIHSEVHAFSVIFSKEVFSQFFCALSIPNHNVLGPNFTDCQKNFELRQVRKSVSETKKAYEGKLFSHSFFAHSMPYHNVLFQKITEYHNIVECS